MAKFNEDDIEIVSRIDDLLYVSEEDSTLEGEIVVCEMPDGLYDLYLEQTNINNEGLGRIEFLRPLRHEDGKRLVIGRVYHGGGYCISQDIYNSITEGVEE